MQGTRIRRITIWLAAAIATLVVGASAAMAYPADPFGDGSSPSQWQQQWQQQHTNKGCCEFSVSSTSPCWSASSSRASISSRLTSREPQYCDMKSAAISKVRQFWRSSVCLHFSPVRSWP